MPHENNHNRMPADSEPLARKPVDRSFDLKALEETLRNGTFYDDYDESSRLLGALQAHLKILPKIEQLIDGLAEEQSWKEKVIAKAKKQGITDPDELEEIADDAMGDENDDFLLEKSSTLAELAEMAREVLVEMRTATTAFDDASPGGPDMA